MNAKLSRCDFYEDRIHFLSHIILDKGIFVDPEKIEAMMSFPSLRKLTNVRYFVGLAGDCRRFTEGYSTGKSESMYRMRNYSCELVVP